MASSKQHYFEFQQVISIAAKQQTVLPIETYSFAWLAFKKLIVNHSTYGKRTLVCDAFYLWKEKKNGKATFMLVPTEHLINFCALKYRFETIQPESHQAIVNQTNLYKNISQNDKIQHLLNKQSIYLALTSLVHTLKALLKSRRNLEIALDYFGTLKIYQKSFTFQPQLCFEQKSIFESSSISFKSKKQNNTQQKSIEYFPKDKLDQSNGILSTRKKLFFHEIIQNCQPEKVRITNDLLGAGIDPLTFDYNFSKLIDQPCELVSKEFKKFQNENERYPSVIDKFSRTKGSQLTSIKVGNSIIMRIGNNYTPTAKNYYIDSVKKRILSITHEVKIKLQDYGKIHLTPASQAEEYTFLIDESSAFLKEKVDQRRQNYQRYQTYFTKIIPNDCVAPFNKQVLQRIIKQIKRVARKFQKNEGQKLIHKLLEEVNKSYYQSYKKSILDYILKDKDEMLRTGINTLFNPIAEWGQPKTKQSNQNKMTYEGHIRQDNEENTSVNLQQIKAILTNNHLHYPSCIEQIFRQNQKLDLLELFKTRKQIQYKPFNILYYIKRNINQLHESTNFLKVGWVEKIADLIKNQINFKKQNIDKLKQFFSSVHTIMSNKLKELVYRTLNDIEQEITAFDGSIPSNLTANGQISSTLTANGQISSNLTANINNNDKKQLLYLCITEENLKIHYIDEIQNSLCFEMIDIINKIVNQTRKIPRIECYFKNKEETYIWGVDENDPVLRNCQEKVKRIVDFHYKELIGILQKLKIFQQIFLVKEEIINWCKSNAKMIEVHSQLEKIKGIQQNIQKIPFYYKTKMAVINCNELKKKLFSHMKATRKIILDSLQDKIKQNISNISNQIYNNMTIINRFINNTSQFVKLSHQLEYIKSNQIKSIKALIDANITDLFELFKCDGFVAGVELLKSAFLCKNAFEVMKAQLSKNQCRLHEQRTQLQKCLRDKISLFQNQTFCWLKEVSQKVDTFDIRKLYTEYSLILKEYKLKVEEQSKLIKDLNQQEEDLKWTSTVFQHASDSENIVQPNFELWNLVAEYDYCMKEWKYIELHAFDVDSCEKKIALMDAKLSKIISKLKNFVGLKIAYQLHNDVKEILIQQVSIIKIFCHPGLKERHWHLFNKRLPLPGYDLKQLTYGRIKMLYDYQKNLKVLMSISNQAAKEFQIENEKNTMQEYWNKLHFSIRNTPDEHVVFIHDEFLQEKIEIIEHHLMKTIILKNSPFSKALTQMLSEWQTWLLHGQQILIGFRSAQAKFIYIKDIFKMEEINRILPIQSTQYQSIQNIWKSVIKKILEQPKITDFFKSQKMPEIIEEIGKKTDIIKSNLGTYLNAKRSQFHRFYFITDEEFMKFIKLSLNQSSQEALNYILPKCYLGIKTIQKNKKFKANSLIDSLAFDNQNNPTQKKGKSKFFEEMAFLQKNIKDVIFQQIILCGLQQDSLKNEKTLKQITLTSIICHLNIKHTTNFKQIVQQKDMKLSLQKLQKNLQFYTKISSKDLLVKKQVILMNLLSQKQKILRKCKRMQGFNHESFESLCEFKFELSNEKEKKIQIQYLNHKFYYESQYLGEETPAFVPNISEKMTFQIIHTIQNHMICVLKSPVSFNLNKTIAHTFGQNYRELQNPLFLNENLVSCVSGTITTNYWINFIDQFLKFTSEALSYIATIWEQKRQKILRKNGFLSLKSTDLSINLQSKVFMTFEQNRFHELPQNLLTGMRIITNSHKKLSQFLLSFTDGVIVDWSEYTSITRFIQIVAIYADRFNSNSFLTQFAKCYEENSQNLTLLKSHLKKYLNKEQIKQFEKIAQKIIYLKQDGMNNVEILNKSFKKKTQEISLDQLVQMKSQELKRQLQLNDIVFVYGQQSFKSTIIQATIKDYYEKVLTFNQIGLNLNLINISEQQVLSVEGYLNKVITKLSHQMVHKNTDCIVLHIDGEVDPSKFHCLKQYLKKYETERGHSSSKIKIVIQSLSVMSMEPSDLDRNGKIFLNCDELSFRGLYLNWIDRTALKMDQINQIKAHADTFQYLANLIYKIDKRPVWDTRIVLFNRFTAIFQIYIIHLSSQEVQALPEFDSSSYILNSLIYSLYWSLGGCLQENQLESIKKYLHENYSSRMDLNGDLDQHYLNQENQWVTWDQMKEQFNTAEKEVISICSLWVPTANHTRILTMSIKLLEKGHSIMLVGSQCSKSAILSEISSFQTSFSSFLIDCNKFANTTNIINTIKGKILYGENKRNLIIVDDLHLPLKTSVYEACRTAVDQGCLPNLQLCGKLNQNLQNPKMLSSWNPHSSQNCQNNNISPSFWRLYSKMFIMNLFRLDEKQTQAIFRPYLNHTLVNHQFDNSILKLQNIVMNYISQTVQIFSKSLHLQDIRHMIENCCQLTSKQVNEKAQFLKHILISSYTFFADKISPTEQSNFQKHISQSFAKFLSIQIKSDEELKEIVNNYIFPCLTFQKEQQKLPQNMNALQKMLEDILIDKQLGVWQLSSFHIRLIQKIMVVLKSNPSHLILISEGEHNGSRSLMKMVSLLKELGYGELGVNETAASFLEEYIKILKTGGKVDQSIFILPNQPIKRNQFLHLVYGLICSPEFYQCFTQIQMEQIIKSFNSEKKFLKKNVKKSELIKKIREKANNLFHFCISLDKSNVKNVKESYPKLFQMSRIIKMQSWPKEALLAVSKKFISSDNQLLVNLSQKLYQKLTKVVADNNKKVGNVESYTLQFLDLYNKFISYTQQRSNSVEGNSEVWSKRIQINQQKIQNLKKDKISMEEQNADYFQKVQSLMHQITRKEHELEQMRSPLKDCELAFDQINQTVEILTTKDSESSRVLLKEYAEEVQRMMKGYIPQELLQNETRFTRELIEIMAKTNQDQNNDKEILLSKDNMQAFLYNLAKDYFNAFANSEFSDKRSNNPNENQIMVLINKYQSPMKVLRHSKQELNQNQQEKKQTQNKYYEMLNQYRKIQDQISDCREEIETCQEKKPSFMNAYDEIQDKISQSQSILSILIKFQHVLRSKSQNFPLCPQDMRSTAIVLAALLTFSFNLSQEQKNRFKCELFSAMRQIKLQFKLSDLLHYLCVEDQLKFKYLFKQNNLESLLTYIGIEIANTYCTLIDKEDLAMNWLREVKSTNQIKVYNFQKYQQFKEDLQKDVYIVMYSPTQEFIAKLNNIMRMKIAIKNGARCVDVDGEELVIHQKCKIIFIYPSLESMKVHLRNNSSLVLPIQHSKEQLQAKILQTISAFSDIRSNISQSKTQIISKYMNGYKEISSMDDRMHAIILKMKKQNFVSQIILKKIEEEGENKIQVEKKLQSYRQKLNQKNQNQKKYQKVAEALRNLYETSYSKSININFFLFLTKCSLNECPISNPAFATKIIQITKAYCKIFSDGASQNLAQNSTQNDKDFKIMQNLLPQLLKGIKIIQTNSNSIAMKYFQEISKSLSHEYMKIEYKSVENLHNLSTISGDQSLITQVNCVSEWKQLKSLMQRQRMGKMDVKLIVLMPEDIEIGSDMRWNTVIGHIWHIGKKYMKLKIEQLQKDIGKQSIVQYLKENNSHGKDMDQHIANADWLINHSNQYTTKENQAIKQLLSAD